MVTFLRNFFGEYWDHKVLKREKNIYRQLLVSRTLMLRVGFESPCIRGEEQPIDGQICGKFVKEKGGGRIWGSLHPIISNFSIKLKPAWFNSIRNQHGSIKSGVERRELSNAARVVKISYIFVLIWLLYCIWLSHPFLVSLNTFEIYSITFSRFLFHHLFFFCVLHTRAYLPFLVP